MMYRPLPFFTLELGLDTYGPAGQSQPATCLLKIHIQFTNHNIYPLKCTIQCFLYLTKLCNSHHCIIPEHYHHPNRNSIPISSNSFPISPNPLQLLIYYLYGFAYSGHLHKWKVTTCGFFVFGFFHLASCFPDSSLSYHCCIMYAYFIPLL